MVWKYLEILSALLDPDERQSLLGDIAERGADTRALLDLIGLVLLRQLQAGTSIRLWFTAALLFLPLFALTNSAYAFADTASLYPWTDLRELSRPAFVWMILESAVATMTLAWASGYTLATIARHRSLALISLLAALLAGMHGILRFLGDSQPHFASFGLSGAFIAVGAILPLALGVQRGWRGSPLEPIAALLIAAASIPFAFLLPNSPYWSARIVSVLAFWPAYYAIVTTRKKRGSHA